jgi:Icc-related predicted phosphoesterase
MRCLVVADLHYALPQFDWLLDAAPAFDVVVLAGDALEIASLVDFRAQAVVVKTYLARIAALTRVIVCSGNHDLDERGDDGEKVAHWVRGLDRLGITCDGESTIIAGTTFTVCPWWDGPVAKAAIERQLEAAAAVPKAGWIWDYHAPPANSPTSWGGTRHLGDVELSGWIERFQPGIVLSGHVHQSPFVQNGSWYDRIGRTWVFNAGRQFGRPPAYLIVDLGAEMVFWISAGGRQFVHLSGGLHRPAHRIDEPPDWLRALDRLAEPAPVKHPSPVA